MDKFILSINNTIAQVILKNSNDLYTTQKIKSILPQKIDLHYAKVAGEEVFGVLPIIIPPEKGIDVNTLEKDTVVYWPERQFFCIFYGDIQEEDTNVTVIGKLAANEDFINEMEKVRYKQGISMIIKNEDDKEPEKIKSYSHLVNANFDWHSFPDELKNLVKRKGIMQPGGPIIYAEGETRKLADILWTFYLFYQKKKHIPVDILQDILLQSINRIGGWCGLKGSAEVIDQYRHILQGKNINTLTILEDLILYTNRLNMWIDLLIPWEICNVNLRKYNSENNRI